MKNMITAPSKQAFYVDAGSCKLRIFRVGQTPRLVGGCAGDPEALKHIHTHFTYEIFFAVSGTLSLISEIGTTEHNNCILIIPPQIKHVAAPGGGEGYCLLFSLDEHTPAAAAIQERLKQGILELPLAEDVAFYIRQFTVKSLENTDYAEQDAQHLAALIFSHVFHAIETETPIQRKKRNYVSQHINDIEYFINRNIHQKITLSDISAALHLSTKQISRIIEHEYRCTFSDLILDKRLASAEILLKNTDLRISEIARRTFYGTESYFYTAFKNKYGISPRTYRNEIRIRSQEKAAQ